MPEVRGVSAGAAQDIGGQVPAAEAAGGGAGEAQLHDLRPSSTSNVVQPARIRVRFADTDAMGVVWHGNYLAYLEVARVEAMRQVGAVYGLFVERGFHSPIVEANLRYHQPARFDDVLLVRARVVEVRAVRFAFEYEVRREGDGALILSGRTVHACVDATTLRPVRLPDWVLAALGQLRPGA